MKRVFCRGFPAQLAIVSWWLASSAVAIVANGDTAMFAVECACARGGLPLASPTRAPVIVADTDRHSPLLLNLCLRRAGYQAVPVVTPDELDRLIEQTTIFYGAFVDEHFGGSRATARAIAIHLRDDLHVPVILVGSLFGEPTPDEDFAHLRKPFETRALFNVTQLFAPSHN